MDIKNRAITLGSIGFGLGVIIGTIITCVSATYSYADGVTHICAVELVEACGGNELAAFVIQAIVSGLMGLEGMGLSVVYRIEEWSLLKATVVHFAVTVTCFYATAFSLCWWTVKDVGMNLFMLGIFLAEYVLIWVINYLVSKARIARINKDLKKLKESASIV